MKKFSFLAMAAVAALFSSCSSELVPEEVPGTGNEIRVRATAESNTRAAESFCNENLPKDFQLWAVTNGDNASYITNAKMVRDAKNSYEFADGQFRYWPDGKNLDFTAYHSDENTYDREKNAFVDYQIKQNVSEQLDLLYAVKNNVSRNNGTVNLNFRHALCQVVFRMKVTNKTLKVVVNNVEIGHLYDKGTFTLPSEEDTEGTFEDPIHNDLYVGELTSGLGNWEYPDFTKENSTRPYAKYIAKAEYKESDKVNATQGISATANDGIVPITQTPNGHGDAHVEQVYWNNVMTLMPQVQKGWDPINSPKEFDGSYACLDCIIYNVDNGTQTIAFQGKTYIPLAVDWKQGVRYIYTFDFANGTGGFTGPDDPIGPQPTLNKINVTLTTDDYFSSEDEDKILENDKYSYKVRYNKGRCGVFTNNWDGKENPILVTNKPSSWTFNPNDVIPTPKWLSHEFVGWTTSFKTDSDDFRHAIKGEIVTSYTLDQNVTTKDENNIIMSPDFFYGVWHYNYNLHYEIVKPIDATDKSVIGTMPNDVSYSSKGDELSSLSEYTHYFKFDENKNITCGNYKLKGWSTKQNASSPETGVTVDIRNADLTVYPVWEKIN